jgi:UDP-N-acetylglucosamine acyltransferase
VNSSHIHPTSVIHPTAQLGEGCEIGPYCVIGEGVRLGDNCWLQNHVTLVGPSRFGAGNRFHSFCSLGQQTQDLKYAGEPTYLEVGDANTFREFVTVNRGTAPGSSTRVGSGGHFLAYSHIAHDCVVGDQVIFSNNGTIAGHVEVGDYAVIGGLTAVHQFCRIGAYAITGGCSKIVQDVPPFMIADGNPAGIRGLNRVGLERHGFAPEAIKLLKEAYRILYRSELNLQQAVARLLDQLPETPELLRLVAFLSSSSRGVIR